MFKLQWAAGAVICAACQASSILTAKACLSTCERFVRSLRQHSAACCNERLAYLLVKGLCAHSGSTLLHAVVSKLWHSDIAKPFHFKYTYCRSPTSCSHVDNVLTEHNITHKLPLSLLQCTESSMAEHRVTVVQTSVL